MLRQQKSVKYISDTRSGLNQKRNCDIWFNKRVKFYTFLWKCYYLINLHRSHTVMEKSWIERLNILTWLSQNWRAMIWLKLHGDDGIRETGLQSFLFRNRGKVTLWWERYKQKTERDFLHEELFLGLDGPCVAQQAKESWKAIRKKLFFSLCQSPTA